MYPVTEASPTSPSDHWIVRSEDVLVMDMSMGDPGEPVKGTHSVLFMT